jgi:hypothetical protein
MRYLILVFSLISVVGCSTSNKSTQVDNEKSHKFPTVTIETSGDLYHEEGGGNIQMDLFGNCAPKQTLVYIEVDKKKVAAPCSKGRYRYSLNLPESFFERPNQSKRLPSSQYVMKEINAYHGEHKKLKATSFILIDRKSKEVKSVINKQVRFEKIPTGEYEPITQYNAFGSCTYGSTVTIDLVSPDRFGHMVSKYDEKKKCENAGGYYFISQIHGVPAKGSQFKVYEDMPQQTQPRGPASTKKTTYKNLFNWQVPVN